jgi:hypothetical protein
MDSWLGRIRPGPIKALLVACVLAGVFAMHGLTGSHDATMALADQMPGSATSEPVQPAASSHRERSLPEAAHPMSAAATEAPTGPELTVQAGHDGHSHAMGDACLAMLSALLLALVVALALGSLTLAHPIPLAVAAVRVTVDKPSPAWCRPTLSKLCVLRT